MTFKSVITTIAGAAFALSFAVASAATLTTSCTGVPTATNIVWTASYMGGVTPVTFLWGNSSTSTTQTIAVAPGTYSMTLQATDASSTVATTTCSATVAQPAPTITSFIATPSSIISGQGSVLSWVVGNASSTSIDNGIGAMTGTSVTVTPSVTTTYHLSAVNPVGTTSASAAVTVGTSTTTGGDLAAQIQALLNQIANLKAQILQLIFQQQSGGTGTSTPPTNDETCFDFHRDLHDGDDGDDVKALQRMLAHDPSIFPPGLITGFFGHRTEEAVRKFQRKFGIFSVGSTTTGFFGPRSREHFRKECGSQDNDHDGINNNDDDDDDNDGILDVNDRHPFRSDVIGTSTPSFRDEHHEKGEDRRNHDRKKDERRGGHGNDEGDSGDD